MWASSWPFTYLVYWAVTLVVGAVTVGLLRRSRSFGFLINSYHPAPPSFQSLAAAGSGAGGREPLGHAHAFGTPKADTYS